VCDALLVDTISRSDTYPYVDIREDDVSMGHEATGLQGRRTSCST
jgi:Fe-S cluster assembly scaffold protein SufB